MRRLLAALYEYVLAHLEGSAELRRAKTKLNIAVIEARAGNPYHLWSSTTKTTRPAAHEENN